MNGFVVGDAGDVEKQELFVERPGDFIVAEHLALEHRRPDAAADGYRDRAGEQVEARATHKVVELPFGTPGGGSRGLGCRLLDDSDDDGGYSSHYLSLQTRRERIVKRGWPTLDRDRVMDQGNGGEKKSILIHSNTPPTRRLIPQDLMLGAKNDPLAEASALNF